MASAQGADFGRPKKEGAGTACASRITARPRGYNSGLNEQNIPMKTTKKKEGAARSTPPVAQTQQTASIKSVPVNEIDRLITAKIQSQLESLRILNEVDATSVVTLKGGWSVPESPMTANSTPPSLQQLVAYHSEALDALDDVVSKLHEKLDAVCRPVLPSPETAGQLEDRRAVPSESYLSDRLNMASHKARTITARLNALIGRIDL